MARITLTPLTRVEGDGRVDLVLRGGKLASVQVSLTESPRLLETLVRGRPFHEVPALVCRICAICSSVHRLAAARAMEKALAVEVPPAAALVRELLLLGGHIESHALHLFCLILPDLEGADDVLELLRRGHPAASGGLALKGLGNRIQGTAGGRTIHPVNIEVGGVLQLPARNALEALLTEFDGQEAKIHSLVAPFGHGGEGRAAVGTRISVAPAGDRFALTGTALALSDGRTVPGEEYREVLAERPVSGSNARQSGSPERPFLAGALARLENAGRLGLCGGPAGELPGNIHGNNAAQGLELLWALREARLRVEALLALPAGEPLQAEVRPRAGVGTEVIEAPRGLLVHHYGLDDLGRVAAADIVTPTAINQAAMAAQLQADLAGAGEEEIRRRAPQIIRAFDPCISCSVHVVGR